MHRSILVVVPLVALGACNPTGALTIPEPDTVQPGNVNNAAALGALRDGTLSAFQIAYSGAADLGNGGHEGQINMTGLFTDELQDEETFPGRIAVDGRLAAPGNNSLMPLYVDIQAARAVADKTDAKYAQFAPSDPDHALVLSIGAFVYTLLAENYCEGVPVSSLADNGAITYGVPLTRAQLLGIATARFDSALTIAGAAGDAANANLASVGLARALLDGGDDGAAAAAVAKVPVTFEFDIGASSNTLVETNGIWNYTIDRLDFSVSDREGVNGLPFVSANDPRVPVLNTGQPGFSSGTNLFIQQLRYPGPTTAIPLATGIEAQLIVAEHQLKSGGPWLATLNALRARTPGLPALVDPGTPAGRLDLVFSERAFWLFLTSHRLGDLRRLIRQYGRTANAVFPVGTDIKGQPYGADVNFAVSANEENNPAFHGCLNRDA